MDYPKDVKVNFRKLNDTELRKIIAYFKYDTGEKEWNHEELAALTARLFRINTVVDSDVIDAFADHPRPITKVEATTTKRRRPNEPKKVPEREPAKPGEQVAAKVLSGNENGSWILGNVLDYDANRDLYEIQDEDDTSRIMSLTSKEVKRLEDTTAHFRKGDGVLCVFPDTTSFYRAIVAKNPKVPPHGNSSWDLVVRFEDDEDESGKAPPRRVPGRFVLRRSDAEVEEED